MVNQPRLRVAFYRSESALEPVRNWLKDLTKEDRRTIGEDIKTVQFGWPLGMPVVRKLEPGLWEVRSRLNNRTARVFFAMHQGKMVLLHGVIKKSQRTPTTDLNVARQRAVTLETAT